MLDLYWVSPHPGVSICKVVTRGLIKSSVTEYLLGDGHLDEWDVMSFILRGEKPSQGLLQFNMGSAGEDSTLRMCREFKEATPDPAWYLTQTRKYLGGAPGQRNTKAEL